MLICQLFSALWNFLSWPISESVLLLGSENLLRILMGATDGVTKSIMLLTQYALYL